MDKVVIYNVWLYCRLSLDDGNVSESGSFSKKYRNDDDPWNQYNGPY